MKTKICSKCHIKKELREFYFRNPYYRSECKQCSNISSVQYHEKNKIKNKEKRKKYYLDNKEKILIHNKINYTKNKYLYNKTNKKYRDSHKEQLAKQQKNWRDSHKIFLKNKKLNRLNNDPNYKLKLYMRSRINLALESNQKSGHTLELLGCSIEFLKQHLESQFTEGMSWENHNLKGWHVDHIYPCASFDLSKPEEQQICFHWSNLQPLWWYDNLSKGART
jgi:hypothetical protein